MLGGTSSLNYLFYVRGDSQDYDHWHDHFGLEGIAIENLKQCSCLKCSYLKCSYLKIGSHGNALAVSFFKRCARLRSCAYDFHCSIQKRCGKLGRYLSFNEIHVGTLLRLCYQKPRVGIDMLFIYSYNFNAVCNQLKLVSFKEEQRPDRIDAASYHMGATILAHMARSCRSDPSLSRKGLYNFIFKDLKRPEK